MDEAQQPDRFQFVRWSLLGVVTIVGLAWRGRPVVVRRRRFIPQPGVVRRGGHPGYAIMQQRNTDGV